MLAMMQLNSSGGRVVKNMDMIALHNRSTWLQLWYEESPRLEESDGIQTDYDGWKKEVELLTDISGNEKYLW